MKERQNICVYKNIDKLCCTKIYNTNIKCITKSFIIMYFMEIYAMLLGVFIKFITLDFIRVFVINNHAVFVYRNLD